MSEASKQTPSAWRVTGGRAYVDTAHIDELQAKRRASERKDGARVAPLYSDDDVMQLVEQRDALVRELETVRDWAVTERAALRKQEIDSIDRALALVKGAKP